MAGFWFRRMMGRRLKMAVEDLSAGQGTIKTDLRENAAPRDVMSMPAGS
jgi:hypothetical protein